MSSIIHDLVKLPRQLYWVQERHLLEFLLLLDGRKSVVRIPVCNTDEWKNLKSMCEVHHLRIIGSAKKTVIDFVNALGEEYVSWVDLDDPRDGGQVAYIAHNELQASKAECAERNGDPFSLGKLLGYPDCCVRAYSRMANDGIWLERLLPSPGSGPLPWEANKLAYALYDASLFPDYFPCSLDCPGTTELARQAAISLGRHGLGEVAQRHARLMQAPVAVFPDRVVGLEPEYALTNSLHDLAALAERPTIRLNPDYWVHTAAAKNKPYILTFT